MPLALKIDELTELMRDFHTLTGIRCVLFDENGTELISYPHNGIPFCRAMRAHGEFDAMCRESDGRSFDECKRNRRLTIFRCHAGLIEASAPLLHSGTVLGYIMFGQIADTADRESVSSAIAAYCEKYGISDAKQLVRSVSFKKREQITAAAKILDACTSYILLKEMVTPAHRRIFDRIDIYCTEHIHEKITVERLCNEFGISRTRLYEAVKPYVHGGIAAWINSKRMEEAKRMLTETDADTEKISEAVGFQDHAYFLRVFKRFYGISPSKMRDRGM